MGVYVNWPDGSLSKVSKLESCGIEVSFQEAKKLVEAGQVFGMSANEDYLLVANVENPMFDAALVIKGSPDWLDVSEELSRPQQDRRPIRLFLVSVAELTASGGKIR